MLQSYSGISDSSKNSNEIKTKDGVASAQLDAWTAHKTESGTIYYYNALTGESTYERPVSFNKEVITMLDSSLLTLNLQSWISSSRYNS